MYVFISRLDTPRDTLSTNRNSKTILGIIMNEDLLLILFLKPSFLFFCSFLFKTIRSISRWAPAPWPSMEVEITWAHLPPFNVCSPGSPWTPINIEWGDGNRIFIVMVEVDRECLLVCSEWVAQAFWSGFCSFGLLSGVIFGWPTCTPSKSSLEIYTVEEVFIFKP